MKKVCFAVAVYVMFAACLALGMNLKAAAYGAETSKPAIVLCALDDMTEDGKVPAPLISSTKQAITAALIKSKVFTVVERDKAFAYHAAMQINSGQYITAAQYIMVGAVTLCHYSNNSSGLIPVLGTSAKAGTAYVALNIRIFDVSTSSILYWATQIGEAGNKDKRNVGSYNERLSRLLTQAAGIAVDKHISAIKALAWPNTKELGNSNSVNVILNVFEDRCGAGDRLVGSISNRMFTELYKVRAFDLLERERLEDIKTELDLANAGWANPSTAPEIGKIRGAQYMITGAITLYHYTDKEAGFIPVLGIATKPNTAYVVLDIRIIETKQELVVYSYTNLAEATNNENNRDIVHNKDTVLGLLAKAANNAIEEQIAEIKTLAWLNAPAPKTIKAQASKKSASKPSPTKPEPHADTQRATTQDNITP